MPLWHPRATQHAATSFSEDDHHTASLNLQSLLPTHTTPANSYTQQQQQQPATQQDTSQQPQQKHQTRTQQLQRRWSRATWKKDRVEDTQPPPPPAAAAAARSRAGSTSTANSPGRQHLYGTTSSSSAAAAAANNNNNHSQHTTSSSSNKNTGSGSGSSSANATLQQSTTPLVWLVVWSIACAGFLVGYTQGANVAVSEAFRDMFLPQLPGWHGGIVDIPTCKQQVYRLSWYLTPKYVTGFLAALPIGWIIRVTGRRISLGIGCGVYIVAQLMRGTSSNLAVLLVGQGVDGIACAFLYQAPYLEAVEVAPPKWRGAFGYSIQLGRSIGLFCRGLLMQGIAGQPTSPKWGWRLAVLFPIWPAMVIMMLVPLLPETPNSLMQRGQLAEARAALQEIRGPLVDVEEEFANILEAAGIEDGRGQSPLSQFRTLVQPHQLPPLLILLVMTAMREYTGADFILTYSLAVRGLGLGFEDAALTFALRQVATLGYVCGAVLGALLIDSWGRRPVFLLSSGGGAVFYILLAATLTAKGPYAVTVMAEVPLNVHLLMHAAIILAFACYSLAWGIGYFVLMAELFPLATRSLAMSLTQGLTFCMYSVAAGTCLWMMCEVHLGLLWLFAATNIVATVFVYLFLPETKRVPLEDVGRTFRQPPHWLWKHFYTNRSSSFKSTRGGSRNAARTGMGLSAGHAAHAHTHAHKPGFVSK